MQLTLQSRFLCVLNSIAGSGDLWGMEVQLRAFLTSVIVGVSHFPSPTALPPGTALQRPIG